jgi:hypothetical protein
MAGCCEHSIERVGSIIDLVTISSSKATVLHLVSLFLFHLRFCSGVRKYLLTETSIPVRLQCIKRFPATARLTI